MADCPAGGNYDRLGGCAERNPDPCRPVSPAFRPGECRGSALCATCVRENLEFLAGPKLNGRGSGTSDEYHAAEFIASKLWQYGIAPAAENQQYIQTATVESRTASEAPVLSFNAVEGASSQPIVWTHGKEIVAFQLAEPVVQGPLQKLDLTQTTTSPNLVRDGAVVLLKVKPETSMKDFQAALQPYVGSKAAIVIVSEVPGLQATMTAWRSGFPERSRGWAINRRVQRSSSRAPMRRSNSGRWPTAPPSSCTRQ